MRGVSVDVFYDDCVEGSVCRMVAWSGFVTFIKLSFFVVVMVVVVVVEQVPRQLVESRK